MPEARADSVGVVARGPADAPVPAAALGDAMADALRGAGASPVQSPFAYARGRLDLGAVASERLAGFSRARNLAREGWRAYAAVDSERAMERLLEAREAARAVLDLDGGPALYADIALRLGAVQLQRGQSAEAAESFRLARALDPERAVSIASFAPDIVKAFDDANAAEIPTAKTEVISAPTEARIELDGRYVGPAPVVIRAPAGEHILVARAPGHTAHIQPLTLRVDGPESIAIALSPDPETAAISAGSASLAVGGASAAARDALAALIRYGELDGVVLVASVWRRGQLALLGQYCISIPAACTRVIEIRFPRRDGVRAACAQLWSSLAVETATGAQTLLGDPRLAQSEGRPLPVPSERGPSCQWCRSPWLWIGASVAVVAAGAAFLVLRDGEIEPVVTVDPCEFGSCSDR